MYIRIKHTDISGHSYEYLQIVEAFRQGKKVRQKVVANIGRMDKLLETGQIDKIIAGLSRYSQAYRAFKDFINGNISGCTARSWGPALVFGRLWQEQGLPKLLGRLAAGRKFGFDLERISFALALQRLCAPGSDLLGSSWLKTVEAPGFEDIRLHQMYRAVEWLAEARQELERELFFQDRDLFHQELDLVFLDTTSTYVYRDEETDYCKRGYSRDHRPDLPQLVLCVAVDRQGWPVAWELFPGNTADKTAFVELIDKLRGRFKIRRICVVADRGMISRDTISLLEDEAAAPFDYILGCRMRRDKEVFEDVLSRPGRYKEVDTNLKVKEVVADGKRYIVCRNDEEAKKDVAAREAMLEKLIDKLESGQAKSLVGNSGYRRFLKGDKGAWRIDFDAVKRDERFDGAFVLRTSMDLPPDHIAKTYKGLWRVERTFREQKSTLQLRPLFHHSDEARIGHIVASFLALRLEVDLQRRLDEKGIETSWPDLMRDLSQVQAVDLAVSEDRFRIRTDLSGCAADVFETIGMRPPPRISGSRTDRSA